MRMCRSPSPRSRSRHYGFFRVPRMLSRCVVSVGITPGLVADAAGVVPVAPGVPVAPVVVPVAPVVAPVVAPPPVPVAPAPLAPTDPAAEVFGMPVVSRVLLEPL